MTTSNRKWIRIVGLVLFVRAVAAPAQAQCTNGIEVVAPPAGATAEARGSGLKAAIEAGGSCKKFMLAADTTYTIAGATHSSPTRNAKDGVRIREVHDVTIQGAGPSSVVKFTRATYIGFVIDSNVANLTIRDLKILGSLDATDSSRRRYQKDSDEIVCNEERDHNPCFSDELGSFPSTHAIGVYGNTTGIQNVLITGLTIEDVAVGINVGSETSGSSCTAGVFKNVTVSNNHLKRMHGRDSGSGYGIVTACASNLLVIDNVIENSGRHAIYHGRTVAADDCPSNCLDTVRIVRNTSVDHGDVNGVLADGDRAAIVAARSRNVSIVANTVIGPHQAAISVETVGTKLARNIAVIANHFIDRGDAPPANIWIDSAYEGRMPEGTPGGPVGPVVLWGNHRNSKPANVSVVNARVDSDTTGKDSTADISFWNGTQWIEFAGSASNDVAQAGQLQNAALYVVQNNVLHRVTPVWGTVPGNASATPWPYIYSTPWSAGPDFQGMALLGGDVYLMANSILYRVTPGAGTGAWSVVNSTTNWSPNFSGMLGQGGRIHVLQNSVLHGVAPSATTSAWPYDPNPPASPDAYLNAIGGDGMSVYVQRNPGAAPRIFRLASGYRSPLEID